MQFDGCQGGRRLPAHHALMGDRGSGEPLLSGTVFLARIVPKRRVSSISPNDILSLIVIGGLSADAIASGSTSMIDILLMIGIIVAWGYLLDTLEYRFAFVRRLMAAGSQPQEQGDQQRIGDVDDEAADQRDDDEGAVGGAVLLGDRRMYVGDRGGGRA